ncbi:MAG: hypothetical protein AAGB04_05885 [Pseudomonadota bacterium]
MPWRKALPAWVQALVLLVVFAGGVGVGAIGASRYILTRMQHYRAHPKALPAEITSTLTGRLGLVEKQSEDVLAVITHRHGRIEAMRQRSAPDIHSEFDLMEQEVADVLDEQQQRQWSEIADWVRKSFLPLNPKTQQP